LLWAVTKARHGWRAKQQSVAIGEDLSVISGTSFIVATCFGLIRPSSGQHSEMWGTISAYYVLWNPILLTRCT